MHEVGGDLTRGGAPAEDAVDAEAGGGALLEARAADDEQRHPYHLQQIRRGIYGAGVLTLAACLLFAGWQLLDSRQLLAQKEEFAAAAQAAQAHAPVPTGTAELSFRAPLEKKRSLIRFGGWGIVR